MSTPAALDIVRREALCFEATPHGLRPLINAIGKATLVFYRPQK
jgi:hypothetical protein